MSTNDTNFEYEIFDLSNEQCGDCEETRKILNSFGVEGWELVQIIVYTTLCRYVMKRAYLGNDKRMF